MKKLLFALCLAAVSLCAAEKKVMTIGNSFTWSLRGDFPALVKSQKDKLTLGFANHGGCTIQRHWEYVEKEETNAEVKLYKYKGKKMKLREMLAAEKWDVVTIQQQSLKSSISGSFYPEVDKLIAYVRKHAPGAEIVLQQTWAYRSDDRNLRKIGGQRAMYDRIYANYKEVSQKFGLRVIPTGLALEIAREKQPVKFVPVPKKVLAEATMNTEISQPGSFIRGWQWRKDKKSGKIELKNDSIHLNKRGEYLQACVWYGFLFGKSPEEIKYNGRGLDEKDAAMLRECAAKALKEYK